jgi:hypothetical protein
LQTYQFGGHAGRRKTFHTQREEDGCCKAVDCTAEAGTQKAHQLKRQARCMAQN